MLNLLSILSPESILPIFPAMLGGMNASRLRLQLIDPEALLHHQEIQSRYLDSLLDDDTQSTSQEAEDLEEYCTYLHALIRSVDGARGIPILHVTESWYRFRSAYLELFTLPPHLVMPYLNEKIQALHILLNQLEEVIRNPNLELSARQMEHEIAIIRANRTHIHLMQNISNDVNPSPMLRNMVVSEDSLNATRYNMRFPDYCQARLMTANQYNIGIRNLNPN